MFKPMIVYAMLSALFSLVADMGAAEVHEKPLMRDFMGINGHFHFKPELYRPTAGLVRNYHNMNWDVAKPGDAITVPKCVNGVHWDNHAYDKWAQHGFEIDLCAQFGSFGEANTEYRGLWEWQEQWAYDYGYALAAHFGSAGKATVTSIEIGNEPGSDFDDSLYKVIYEKMASGIRAADPQMKIVSCTAHYHPADKYSKNIAETFDNELLRDLVDVWNVHTYAVLPKGLSKSPWTRTYPEDTASEYLAVVDEVIAREADSGKEIWVTEFGYDACTPQAMEKRTGWFHKLDWQGYDDLQQAQYLVRSFLLLAGRKVDRAYLYFYDDKDAPSVHAASGLTRNFVPKSSYHAVAQLQRLLGDYRFKRVVAEQANKHMVYEFEHGDDAQKLVWVAWSPTGCRTDQRVGYKPRTSVWVTDHLPGTLLTSKSMAISQEPPGAALVTREGNELQLTVGESPCYIIWEVK